MKAQVDRDLLVGGQAYVAIRPEIFEMNGDVAGLYPSDSYSITRQKPGGLSGLINSLLFKKKEKGEGRRSRGKIRKEENMDLLPWRPVESISGLRKEMDRLFERFFGEGPRWELFEERWAPSLDVSETKDEILVKAEVPGIDPKNISISLSGDTLTIKGEKKQEKEEKEQNFYRMERSWGSFSRVIRIPVSVQPDKIKASHKNGVLTVSLPKSEEVKPKEISVEVS